MGQHRRIAKIMKLIAFMMLIAAAHAFPRGSDDTIVPEEDFVSLRGVKPSAKSCTSQKPCNEEPTPIQTRKDCHINCGSTYGNCQQRSTEQYPYDKDHNGVTTVRCRIDYMFCWRGTGNYRHADHRNRFDEHRVCWKDAPKHAPTRRFIHIYAPKAQETCCF